MRIRGRRDGYEEGDGDQEGADKLGEDGGPGEGGFQGVASVRRIHVACGGPDPQRGGGVTAV